MSAGGGVTRLLVLHTAQLTYGYGYCCDGRHRSFLTSAVCCDLSAYYLIIIAVLYPRRVGRVYTRP